jgi:hypothetical protein
VWSIAGAVGVVHRIYDTRATSAAKEMLGNYSGTVLTDGYAVYEKVSREGGRTPPRQLALRLVGVTLERLNRTAPNRTRLARSRQCRADA